MSSLYSHYILPYYSKINSCKYSNQYVIEEFISGKELTVSTIKFSRKIKALAITEIKTNNLFFDYQAKYSKGYAKHILPAKISKKSYNKWILYGRSEK